MDQTVEKTIDRLSELLDRATKTAHDLEVKDRLTDAVSALRRTRITQDDDSGVERFVTGLLLGVAVGFGLLGLRKRFSEYAFLIGLRLGNCGFAGGHGSVGPYADVVAAAKKVPANAQ